MAEKTPGPKMDGIKVPSESMSPDQVPPSGLLINVYVLLLLDIRIGTGSILILGLRAISKFTKSELMQFELGSE